MDLKEKHLCLQKKLMELMLEVDNICKKNDIIYYLHAGNVIGAIRHRGFIPWDDDVDIIMTPENWRKFYAACQKEKVKNRALVCRENNPEHTYLFARYVDTTTTYTFRWKAFNTEQEGIGIDIAIFDKVSNSIYKQQKYRKWMILLGEFIGRRTFVNDEGNIRLYQGAKFLAKIFGNKTVINFIEKMKNKYTDENGGSYIPQGPHKGFNWSCSAEYLGQPEVVEVEGHKLYAPTNARGFVRKVYGDDWMILPDPEQRRIHMGKISAYSSVNVSDGEAERDAANWVDSSKYDDCYVKQKPLVIKRTLLRKKQDLIDSKIKCYAYYIELESKLEFLDYNLSHLLDNNNYVTINSIFSEYVNQQLKEYKKIDFISNTPTVEQMSQHTIPISYEHLYIVCMSLTVSGKYYVAQKILDLHFGVDGDRPLQIKRLQELIDANREWSVARYDNKDWGEIERISNKWLPKYPYHVDFLYGDLFIKLKRDKNKENVFNIIKQAEDALKIHPNSVELLRIVADAKLKLDYVSEARKLYKEILKTSCNGALNLEIKDSLKKMKLDVCENIQEEFNYSKMAERNSVAHNKLLQLLSEVDLICKEREISYFLEPILAWESINKGEFVEKRFSNRIIMQAKSRKRFIEAVLDMKKSNRVLECFETNEDYAEFSLRYCDTSSILLNCDELGLYNNNNISVEIVFIKPHCQNRFEKKIKALALTSIKNASRPSIFLKRGLKHFISGAIGVIVTHIFGKSRVKEKCWKWVYQPEQDRNKIKGEVRTFNSKWLKLPVLDFDEKEITYIKNRPFPVPKNYIEYVKSLNKKPTGFSYFLLNSEQIILIPECNGQILSKGISKKDIKERIKLEFKIRSLSKKIKIYSPYIIRGWEHVQRGFIRTEMIRKYMPQKKKIMALYNAYQYEELEKILKEYIDNIKIFSNKKLALYFDKDIFRVTWEIMEKQGCGSAITNVLSHIPIEHIKRERGKRAVMLKPVCMQKELEQILNYLKHDQKNCLYLYADLSIYGLNNSNIKVWYDKDKQGIRMVVMQYHESFQVYSNRSFEDVNGLIELIRKKSPHCISARREIIEIIEEKLPQYFSEYGVIMENPQINLKNDYNVNSMYRTKIREADIIDCEKITDLIFTSPEISAPYTKEVLLEELKERIQTGMGRSFIIENADEVVAHVATYAETESFVIVGGFVVHPDFRDSEYAYHLEKFIADIINREGKKHVGMITSRRLQRMFERKGSVSIAKYGKLSLKDK